MLLHLPFTFFPPTRFTISLVPLLSSDRFSTDKYLSFAAHAAWAATNLLRRVGLIRPTEVSEHRFEFILSLTCLKTLKIRAP